MNISEKIIQLRKALNLSQEELAEKIGVSRQAISRWENGTALPDAYNLVTLSKLFNVTTDYILGNEKEENVSKHSEDYEATILIKNSMNQLRKIDQIRASLEEKDEKMREMFSEKFYVQEKDTNTDKEDDEIMDKPIEECAVADLRRNVEVIEAEHWKILPRPDGIAYVVTGEYTCPDCGYISVFAQVIPTKDMPEFLATQATRSACVNCGKEFNIVYKSKKAESNY